MTEGAYHARRRKTRPASSSSPPKPLHRSSFFLTYGGQLNPRPFSRCVARVSYAGMGEEESRWYTSRIYPEERTKRLLAQTKQKRAQFDTWKPFYVTSAQTPLGVAFIDLFS